MDSREALCYTLLKKVFVDKAYASVVLDAALRTCPEQDKPYITKLFYGVLERSVYYDAVIASFATQKPKTAVAILIKMGYYLLEHMRVPDYAAVNTIVSLCKKVGKGQAAGFVNAALRHFSPPTLAEDGTAEYLSVRHSVPLWLVRLLITDYGYDFAAQMLGHVPDHRTHIRVNEGTLSKAAFAQKYERLLASGQLSPSPVGYFAAREGFSALAETDYVVQSAASIAAVEAYLSDLRPPAHILDLCAAPGGKAVLLAKRTHAETVACDLYPHRIQMIARYANACRIALDIRQNDATLFEPAFEKAFDLVICDVPCSGLGDTGSKPDILFNRSEQDIQPLTKVQAAILNTAKRYVKKGGRLCYSTCSVLKAENSGIADRFAQENPDFVRTPISSPYTPQPVREICLFPHLHGTDGFYITAFTKKG